MPEKRIWVVYAIVEELQNDPYGEFGGKLRMDKLVPPGLGQSRFIARRQA